MTDELEKEFDDDEDLDDPDYDIDRYGDLANHFDADRYNTAAGWKPKDEFKELRDKHRRSGERLITEYHNILDVRPANGWMKDRSVKLSAPLFGEMWKEGELAILFADTGCGKSIFAVQLAESIALGQVWSADFSRPDADSSDAITPKKVLYLDFELTETQFNERYSRHEDGKCVDRYKFSNRNMRAQIRCDREVP